MASSTTSGAGPQPKRGFKQILNSYFYWTYPRGSFHYDVMVTLILLFIFVTPHLWDYGAKPSRRPRAPCIPSRLSATATASSLPCRPRT